MKFSNTHKLNELNLFVSEYRRVLGLFVNHLWELGEYTKIPVLLPKEYTDKISTWLSSRAVQAVAKQASGVIRGVRTKQKRRLYQINRLNEAGKFKQARKLQKIYDEAKNSKPKINEVCPELDSRFVKISLSNPTSFDGWITLASIGDKLKILIPFKNTKHFNKMLLRGKLKSGLRLSRKSATFNFKLAPASLKTEGTTVGLDKGIKNVYSLSDKQESGDDIHGWNLDKIIKKMCRQKRGSKAFKRSQEHRKNHIHWCLNQINFSNVKTLNIEKILNMRRGKKTSKYLSRFTYPIIDSKLKDLTLQAGVQIKELSPVYTSQRCSECGWTCKANRKGKMFVCVACGNIRDSDYNASLNISLDLPEITKAKQLQHSNRKGFYWNAVGKEPIVSSVQTA
ncbi:MAG: transposase [Candidatus Cloacimonetes bacterium]|nr:transposase [Candidatus Cloacimonadota bacterium]